MAKAHGHIDAVWLGCFDPRLRVARERHIERFAWRDDGVDPPKLAGGSLGLVFTEIDPGRETWRQLDISMSLHQPATVVLEAHIDCAAVREFLGKKFASESEERVFLISALEKAAKLVGEKFPGRNIQGVLAKPGKNGAPAVFENIFLIDSGSAATGESLAWKTERKS